MRRTILLFALLAALLPAAPLALANLAIDGTVAGADYEAPYQYLRITVRNARPNPLGYELTISNSYVKGTVLLNGQIEPLGTNVHHVAFPICSEGPYGAATGFTIESRDSLGVRLRNHVSTPNRCFLNIASTEAWATAKQMDDFTNSVLTLGGAGAPTHGTPPSIVEQLTPADLPDNWLCYLPYRAVFVDEPAWRALPVEAREPLLQWVRSGGRLTVYHSAEPREEPHLRAAIRWQAESPLTQREEPLIAGQLPGPLVIDPQWLFSGRLHCPSQDELAQNFPYSTAGTTSNLGGLILATLFCIIAGPVNYGYFRRRGRIRMLMISVPAISIVFCLLIAIYFVGAKGFMRKGGSFTVTLLDEARGETLTLSRHMLNSGLYPLGGFGFGRETAVMHSAGENAQYRFDLTRGQRLASGLFLPSVDFHYATLLPGSTRERLVYDAAAGTVTNGFETPIRGVIVQTGGRLYAAGALAPGARAKLEKVPPGPYAGPPGGEVAYVFRDRFLDVVNEGGTWDSAWQWARPAVADGEGSYADGLYLIAFDGPSPTAEPGVNINAGKSANLLIGRFAISENNN